MKSTAKTDDFLRRVKVHPELTDIGEVTRAFMSEMTLGLEGKASSLAMIPAYISVRGQARDNEPVIAVDSGGTNLRVALVTFKDGLPVTERLVKGPIPGSQGEVTADEYFDHIAELILPLTELADKVGFCFSYPMEVTEDLDGRIQLLNKELKVKGAEGMLLGRSLGAKLREKGQKKPMKFVIINDTVAGLMGGIANLGLSDADGMAGLILGTGSNICYFERGERIGKLKNPRDMLINCESGNFSETARGEPDKRLDAASKDPGRFFFEKMMSGAYFGKLISVTAAMAAEEGLLSPAFASGEREPFAAHELDGFLRGEDNRVSRLCTGEDRETLERVCDRLFERSAKLVCASIAALCLHTGGGQSPQAPFTVVAEGSMFWGSLLFKEKLDRHIAEHIEGKLGRHVRICRAENSTMAGSALSALLNT